MFRTNVRHRVLFTIDCRESLVARSCREISIELLPLLLYTVYIYNYETFPCGSDCSLAFKNSPFP